MEYAKYIAVAITAITAGAFTSKGIEEFNDGPRHPNQPPSWVFSVVWSIIYITYAFTWAQTKDIPGWLNALFILNLVLNAGWCYIFFARNERRIALYVILGLLILTAVQAFALWNYTDGPNTGIGTLALLFYASWLMLATQLNRHAVKNSEKL